MTYLYFIMEIKICINKVYSTLGYGYKEHIYASAMAVELRNLNYKFQSEVISPIMYENMQIGYERADIVIYEPIQCVLEFKAQTMILQKKDKIQLKKYLLNLDIPDGILINFGNKLEIIDINQKDTDKHMVIDVQDHSVT